MLRIALPNKGRLADDTLELLELAGLPAQSRHQRALQATLGDNAFHALFVRAEDIPEFVADGAADLGVTGGDLVAESGRALTSLLPLEFGRCRLVIAVRDESDIRTISDIPRGMRIATAFPRITQRFIDESGLDASLVPVSGAAEIAPHLGVADIIVDLVSTGSTLRMNGLREVSTVLESQATLIARPSLMDDPSAAQSAGELATALESVIRAQGQRYLMTNIPRSRVADIKKILPGINGPTIIDVLNGGDTVAAHAVVPQAEVYRVIARLREAGATGILVTRIERLMP